MCTLFYEFIYTVFSYHSHIIRSVPKSDYIFSPMYCLFIWNCCLNLPNASSSTGVNATLAWPPAATAEPPLCCTRASVTLTTTSQLRACASVTDQWRLLSSTGSTTLWRNASAQSPISRRAPLCCAEEDLQLAAKLLTLSQLRWDLSFGYCRVYLINMIKTVGSYLFTGKMACCRTCQFLTDKVIWTDEKKCKFTFVLL